MGILYLVGLGLSWKLTTPLALEVLKGSDFVYFDTYTSFSCDITPERLSSLGINVVRASRKDLENEYKKVIALLDEGKKVAIASVGDPIIATTHEALAIEAAKRGHKVKVIPGVSVLCYILASLEEKLKEGVVTPERIVVIGQRLGCDDEKVSVMKVGEVPNSSLSDPPHILLFPSRRLHFVEEEGLQWLMRSAIE